MSKQLKILEELIAAVEAAGIPIWFYGGYALDALEGKTIRSHGDIDCFVRKQYHERMRTALASSGFAIREKYPHATKFEKMRQSVECLTYERLADGTYVTDIGEVGIYPWPDNSFPDEPNAVLMGKPVRVTSYEAQYVFNRLSGLRPKTAVAGQGCCGASYNLPADSGGNAGKARVTI